MQRAICLLQLTKGPHLALGICMDSFPLHSISSPFVSGTLITTQQAFLTQCRRKVHAALNPSNRRTTTHNRPHSRLVQKQKDGKTKTFTLASRVYGTALWRPSSTGSRCGRLETDASPQSGYDSSDQASVSMSSSLHQGLAGKKTQSNFRWMLYPNITATSSRSGFGLAATSRTTSRTSSRSSNSITCTGGTSPSSTLTSGPLNVCYGRMYIASL